MSTNDLNEPSYYEIALTNRQVMMAFVVVLAAVLGAFVCGVWAGKRGTDQLQARDLVAGNTAGDSEDELKNFKFFTEPTAGDANLDKPDLSQLVDQPDTSTTLAQDVGNNSNQRQPNPPSQPTRPPESAPPPPPPPPPPVRTTPPPPPPKAPPQTPPATNANAVTDGFIVQVFSSQDQPKAKKILADLQGAGYKGFISPSRKGSQNIYRVRIGPYTQKASAERAARGIRGKFQLETWVTAASN